MATNYSSGFIGIARLCWMMLGPATLFLLAGTIAQKGNGWFTPASIAFLIVMVVIVVTRQFDPEDADGEPTTPAHLRRFTVGAIGVGLTVWVIANLLGNHWRVLINTGV